MTAARQTFLLSERRLFRRLVVVVLAANLLIVALIGVVLVQGRAREDHQRADLARNIAAVLNANLSGIIAKVDIALQSVTDEAERQLAAGAFDKPRLDQYIVRTQERLPEIAAFRVANAQGLALYGAEVPVASTKSLAHRDYFQRLRDHPISTLVFSSPLVGGISGKWMILLVRRIDGPGGFGGLAYAGVTLEYLTASFAAFNVGPSGSICLRDASLALVDRFPQAGDPGQFVGLRDAGAELQSLVRQGQTAGTFGSLDVTSFTQVGQAPFTLEVRLAGRDFLAAWESLALGLILAALAFLAITLVFATVYYQNARRNRSAAQALVDRDDQIEALLQEKEVILNEVHHRIKNNMATIAGLLTIQSSLEEEGPPEKILQTASSRVRSMAVLYEKLFLSTNKQEVSLREYFSALLPEIHETFPGSRFVELQMALDDVILTARTASTLGILLNELMTNSMKHAFPHRTQGTIEVTATLKGGQMVMKYRDDGVGLAPEEPALGASGFGLRLIQMMVRQLKATMVRLPGPGTGWTLQFEL